MCLVLNEFTDEYMRGMLAKLKRYTIVTLHRTPRRKEPGADKIVWEHGRRNFRLRKERKLRIVCQVSDGSDVTGLCIFSTTLADTRRILDGDPAIIAGIFTYEIHPGEGFPGDSL